MNLKSLIKAILILMISFGIGSAGFCTARPYLQDNISINGTPTDPSEPGDQTERLPYPGWNERERQRALAVVIDNSPNARPQSGLELAEVVIEVPVEGGQTRFVAIISGEDQEHIGPIRSARSYIVDLAREYQAILVHAGGALDALASIKDQKINNLDEINGGSNVAAAFWRVTEKAKPHNLYSSSDSLRRAAINAKYDLSTPPAQRGELPLIQEAEGKVSSDITVFYPNKLSMVRYQYNKERMLYERFMGEQPHMTAKGEQLTAANVIVQYVSYQYIDGDGRLRLIMYGKGKALIFSGGRVINASWDKPIGKFTKYTDAQGKEILLAQGPTWIEVVTNATRIEY